MITHQVARFYVIGRVLSGLEESIVCLLPTIVRRPSLLAFTTPSPGLISFLPSVLLVTEPAFYL